MSLRSPGGGVWCAAACVFLELGLTLTQRKVSSSRESVQSGSLTLNESSPVRAAREQIPRDEKGPADIRSRVRGRGKPVQSSSTESHCSDQTALVEAKRRCGHCG